MALRDGRVTLVGVDERDNLSDRQRSEASLPPRATVELGREENRPRIDQMQQRRAI